MLEAIKAHIDRVRVDLVEAAHQFRFLGSPSVPINGEDVEANATGRMQLYNYPAGGAPVRTITDGLQSPIGVTVSLVPSR